MSTLNAVNTSLYSTLSGGTALTAMLASGSAVYNGMAPDNAVKPYVVFSQQAGGPMNINPSDIREVLYFVRGYAMTPALAGSIDAQISNLLHKRTLTVTGYTNYMTTRETDISLVETPPDGSKCWMAGAIYRIRLDS